MFEEFSNLGGSRLEVDVGYEEFVGFVYWGAGRVEYIAHCRVGSVGYEAILGGLQYQ